MPVPKLDTTHVVWNTTAILSRAGGSPSAIKELLAAQGFATPSDLALYQWHHRRKIPDKWVPTLVWCVLNAKRAQLSDLLVKRTPRAA